ncbi:pyridoxine 5'-phosphate synthase [Alienimonas californiensis]|uniref:Pyridoxine 5'-phosphate synthase n=1 Tax=Alienimonas californiensis TaxID=2527989 RepID=A0A517P600_9PLAN|nr:pyridoxine 5'-phosphate synthase [Alienimonas californiensis]QDT14804.1 Pyridoxine 5'-phosphate synthase [Alienimonas californiensis]
MTALHVNVDHVATVRQARRTTEPDPVQAAVLAELAGADGITVHLREDRRHIQDRDVRVLRETVQTRLNLEMAPTAAMCALAIEVKPDVAMLVPENRQEITTEGGLNVYELKDSVREAVQKLHDAGIPVSLFLDPEEKQIDTAAELGAEVVELHTGRYAEATAERQRRLELDILMTEASRVLDEGMQLNAGHGLNYRNVRPIAAIPGVRELHIGHGIVSRAVLVGFEQAVREMKALMTGHR